MKKSVLAFVITYLISRFIFYSINFEYNFFIEGVKLGKFLIDFGIWVFVYWIVYLILDKLN